MPDYKEMYFRMFRASTKAINTLVAIQQECEECFLNDSWPEAKLLPSAGAKEERE